MQLFRYLIFIPITIIAQFAVSIVIYNLLHYFNFFNPASIFFRHFLASFIGFQAGVHTGPKSKNIPVLLLVMYMLLVSGIFFQLVSESPLVEGRLGVGILQMLGLCCGSWSSFFYSRKQLPKPLPGVAITNTEQKLYRRGIVLQWVAVAGGLIASLSGAKPAFFLITATLFFLGFGLEIYSRGNHDFWLKVKNHPDLAYDWFKGNDNWIVIDDTAIKDYEKVLSERDWVGPFHLSVPKLQAKTITIYGRRQELRHNQKQFLTLIQTIEN